MTLFGEHYKITRPSSQSQVDFDSRAKCDGAVSYERKHIRLYRYLTPADTMRTYLHEVLHIIADLMGMKKLSADEESINRLASGLECWIRENGIKVEIK